ncbi:MAG: DUF192 domain-containing protein [Acidobacteriota bacterium]|jgi:uncharacterized membrane protein (UPF0127 family)
MNAAAALTVALLLAGASPAAEDAGPSYGRVVGPGGVVLQVELADTPARRARGYMFRDGVGPEDGMLFPFGEESVHTFWMKNVRFPLDIIWMDGTGRVVHVEDHVPACREDPCPSYGPMTRAAYVLELAAGQAAALSLEPGVQLEILIPPPATD